MKAVMPSVPEHILAWRRRTGADQWDEMWEGVLHMAPSPNREHQDLEGKLEFWLRLHWVEQTGGRIYHQINVAEPGHWPDNYRIPDLVLLTPARFEIDCNEYFDGGPDVAIEIRSPDDESYDKLVFYAKADVREVWIVDRDTKKPEIFVLAGDEYRSLKPNHNGRILSPITNVELRAAEDKLEVRLVGRDDTTAKLP